MFEGGRQSPRALPVQIAFLFDCQGSTLVTGSLSPDVFHEKLLNEFPTASVALYGLSGQLIRLAALNRDQAWLKKGIDTPMFPHPPSEYLMDFVGMISQDLARSGRAVRMLAVVSNGQGDPMTGSPSMNQNRYDAAVRAAQNFSVAVYPVPLREQFGMSASSSGQSTSRRSSIGGPSITADSEEPAYRALGNFKNLASPTGGETIEELTGTSLLPRVLDVLAEQIRTGYVVAFALPPSGSSPKRHKIQVVLKDRNRGKISNGERNMTY